MHSGVIESSFCIKAKYYCLCIKNTQKLTYLSYDIYITSGIAYEFSLLLDNFQSSSISLFVSLEPKCELLYRLIMGKIFSTRLEHFYQIFVKLIGNKNRVSLGRVRFPDRPDYSFGSYFPLSAEY